jgi:hypothetical protein
VALLLEQVLALLRVTNKEWKTHNNRVQWTAAVSAFSPLSDNSKTFNFNQRLVLAAATDPRCYVR